MTIGSENAVAETHHYFQALFAEKHKELEEVKRDKPGWIGYGPVFVLALLKDFLDLGMIGSLPGIGTVVTAGFGILMFLLLMLVRTNRRLVDSRWLIEKAWIFIVGILAEFLPGLNLLPLQTTVIFIIFVMDRSLSDQQIAKVIEILHTLHGERASAMQQARYAQKSQEAASEQAAANDAQYQGREAANDGRYGNSPVRRMV